MEVSEENNSGIESKKCKLSAAEEPTKWAILGAGCISGDFAISLSVLPPEKHQLVAVAARSKERAEEFAKKFNIPNSYGSYEELAQDKDIKIDVVYAGLIPTTLHPVAMLFLKAGYRVVCENPFAMNTRQLKDMVHQAKQKNLFLMKNDQGALSPAYKKVLSEIKDGNIGSPRLIVCNVGINLRERTEKEWPDIKSCSGLLVMALACNAIQFVVSVFGREKPIEITVKSTYDGKDDDSDIVTVTLMYSNHRMAVVNSSSSLFLSNEAEVYGSGGSSGTQLRMNYMFCPQVVSYSSFSGKESENFPVPKSEKYKTTFPVGEAHVYTAQCVRDCLLKGLIESPELALEDSLFIMELMDDIRRKIGVVYDEDTE